MVSCINIIGNGWDVVLKKEFEAEYFKKLQLFLDNEYKTETVYPPRDSIFNALKYTPPDKVRVVILCQDPYVNEGQAHGFALSVQRGVAPPPTLKNIFKELESDLNIPVSNNGCLIKWADQGVLLLNAILTVRAGKSNSHANMGWELFTDSIIKEVGEIARPQTFILWGKQAQRKRKFIVRSAHCVIQSPHPSPLSANTGFFGSRPFSKTNDYLTKHGLPPIDWRTEV